MTFTSAALSMTNPVWIVPGVDPGPFHEKPACDRMTIAVNTEF
jgi:hypothetical protein